MEQRPLPHRHADAHDLQSVRRGLERTQDFQIVAEIFRQLAEPTRIRLFWLLCHCEECVVNLSAMLEMSSPALSHHLKPLKTSGLIVSRREGKEVYYRAADTEQSRLLHRMIEQVMDIACPKEGSPAASHGAAQGYSLEQTEIIKKVHQYLLSNLDRHITIEALAAQFHLSPTTLKTAFKAAYGTSIAAHIKEHRMEKAALLLTQTELSIAEVARAVGYDSQSKFTAAFKSFFDTLPKDYRKT